MNHPDQETAELLAHVAIRRHIDRYHSAVDRRDFAAVAACFTDDAEIRSHVEPDDPSSGERRRGGEEYANGIRRLLKFKATSHTLANALITVDGATATADCRVIAWLMGEIDGTDRVFLRGVHVIDDLVRTEAGWRIGRRIHMPEFQFDVPASAIKMPHREGA